MLQGRNVLLGITGSIAAYKSAFLVRLLIQEGANVRVVMSAAAKEFITPLTLATLSKNPVAYKFSDDLDSGEWNNHVELGLWADIFLVAPASANTLAKMADGTCDNLLMACYLSAKCPVYFAPAMDLDMYQHPTTKANIEKLTERGNVFVPATHGELASGLVGEGRMAEPEDIISFLQEDIGKGLPLKGKTVLISAGPTYERIDPVRFIGNFSSGKMGYELAERATLLGAKVVLVSGPSAETTQHSTIEIIHVESAREMYDACTANFAKCDVAIMAAAVADYRPKVVVAEKMKKATTDLSIELEPTEDILAALGSKKEAQFLVGFALETANEEANAKGKLERKNLDMIVLNSLNDEGAGFQHNTNKVTVIDKENKLTKFELKSKAEVAKDIWNQIMEKTV